MKSNLTLFIFLSWTTCCSALEFNAVDKFIESDERTEMLFNVDAGSLGGIWARCKKDVFHELHQDKTEVLKYLVGKRTTASTRVHGRLIEKLIMYRLTFNRGEADYPSSDGKVSWKINMILAKSIYAGFTKEKKGWGIWLDTILPPRKSH